MRRDPHGSHSDLRFQLHCHRNVLEHTRELLLDLLTGEPLPERVRVLLWRELLEVQDVLDYFDDSAVAGSIGTAA